MSTFMVLKTENYTVILADSLGYRRFAGTNLAALNAPKLTHIAPCAFAAHAGTWQPAYEILSDLRDYLLSSPAPRSFDDISEYLEQNACCCYESWCEHYKKESMDVRIPIVLTGPYRHSGDVENQLSSTVLIIETASNLKPRHIESCWWAYDDEITAVLLSLIKLPVVGYLVTSGPLSAVKALKAMHSFISEICAYVSPEPSILLIGNEDEHMLFEGEMVTLPVNALVWG